MSVISGKNNFVWYLFDNIWYEHGNNYKCKVAYVP